MAPQDLKEHNDIEMLSLKLKLDGTGNQQLM